MKKQAVNWIGKALLAGLLAFALLCLGCLLYFNTPVHYTNPDGATEYKYESGVFFRGTEGYWYGRVNNDGFNNARDYTPKEKIDVLLMGSSHMEGFCVPQKNTAAAVLNRLFDGEKYAYSIGMAGHTFLYCAKHLDRALEVYAPGDWVVIELATLSYDPAAMDAACGGTLPETRTLISGGPMMGTAFTDIDIPVTKGCSGILALGAEAIDPEESPCIRCGRCMRACPMKLQPVKMDHLIRSRQFDEADKVGVMNCIECGACTFVCPAKRLLTQSFRAGKRIVSIRRRQQKAREDAEKAALAAKEAGQAEKKEG